MMLIRLAAACCLLLCAAAATAARVEIPLRVSLETMRDALAVQLGASTGKPVFREGRCRFLKLESPRLEAIEGQLRLTAPGSGALGLEMLGHCQNAAAWRGSVQFTLVPHIDSAGRLRVHIVDSRLDDGQGSGPALGLLWDLSKPHLHPRLEQFSHDIGASRAVLSGILRGVAPPEHAAALEQALAQLQVLEPRVEARAVVVPLAMDVPDAWLAVPPAGSVSAAPLTEAELDALDRALQPWDAFLVYSLKQVALDGPDPALRTRLFTLLLESRYRLVGLLTGEEPAAGDPLRALFVEAWNELREILADAERAGLLNASLLRYAVFLDAGDALLALDRAAPGLGMRLSADGLRHLARTLQPGAAGDPLTYGWTVDPQLRALFRVEEIPASSPPPPGRSLLDFFVPRAYAAEPSLDPWIPKQSELEAYQARIASLIAQTTATELPRGKLEAPYDETYRHLVPTTALIESCWRQYQVRGGKVTYLRSAAGSVGLMQINQRVWRGFYDVERLRWDTAYNAQAGAQILMRYLKDYAIPYAQRTGQASHAPRAAYAVYNAGPRAVARFNKRQPHPREKRVDDKLWTLYRAIASGGRVDLSRCGVATPAASQTRQPSPSTRTWSLPKPAIAASTFA